MSALVPRFRSKSQLSIAAFAWLGWAALGCKNDASSPTAHRMELRRLGGELVELVPATGAPPYCLVFSISQAGLVRQLTMNADDDSFDCPAGRPVGGEPFRLLAREGKARLYVVFSDQKLSAGPIAEQVQDFGTKPDWTGLDLRAPGRVVTDVLEFAPEPRK